MGAVVGAAVPKPPVLDVVPNGLADVLVGAAVPKPPEVAEEAPKPLMGLGAAPKPVDAATGCVGAPNAGVDAD